MKRRKFLQATGVGLVGAAALQHQALAAFSTNSSQQSSKNWVWITPDTEASDEDWKKRFDKMKQVGIDAILPEVFQGSAAYYESEHLPVKAKWLEQLIPLAKEAGLEIHAWMWTMPCLVQEIRDKHPEWYNVNRKGESSVDKPAYVDYYRFLCPSRPEVHEFIQTRVRELASFDVDGVHFDYIRHPDVILAEGLQPKYDIVQDKEYPEYDYCYCDVCRGNYKEKYGEDPLEMKDPTKSKTWRQFRFDLITNLVNNKLIPVAKEKGKITSAAVFPNWEHVRQQWSHWEIDALLPMLYHNFYNEDINWIRKQVKKGIKSLQHNQQLYSGLFVPSLKPEELEEAIQASLKGGAKGISLFSFGAVKEEHWNVLEKNLKKA
ncbi:family 10 glycosylhydrolase [Rapidithrix thailandica]|uniref:Family 10 glycosylhydrolase n=1 Tax=Rapidithrix thailandica TaxID=413964 RepID=A0AAW9S4R6_9BACT